ncbi:MAG: response regulator transcription factor [Fidelibacterota bacterium]
MRLLIIEDERALREHIVNCFKSAGFTCLAEATGSAALETVTVDEFDCIILDRKLPDMDGIDLCRNIRKKHYYTPILFLTALAGVEQRIAGLDAGADDYLTKPFSMDELLARVQALIRRSSYQNNPTITIGNVELDSNHRIVKVNDQETPLSNREFLLLEYLMRHAGKPLTRLQILDHVWETNLEMESNLVDVYINYLRKKINPDNTRLSPIETVRGYGYRFRNDI